MDQLIQSFNDEVKYRNRFFHDHEIIPLFNQIITDPNFTEVISQGTVLYRGRVNRLSVLEPYSNEELGIPDATKVSTIGRANPYGINYLYLAQNVDTVIAELRPNRDSVITIGEFELKSNIKVVKLSDLTIHKDKDLCYLALLIGHYFSLPVDKKDSNIEYLPTQYFAELCKFNQLGGIKFLSSVMDNSEKKHFNVTLFSDQNVFCKNKELRRVNSIKYQHTLLK